MLLPPYKGCTNCGDEPQPMQVYQVPTCKSQIEQGPCESHEGKFYDKLTEDFIVPSQGKQANIFVCNARLWAKCQWVGICNGADKIAVYPIMEIGNKTIKVLNGCRSGEEIFGNPEPGKEFTSGTVMFPVPPAGCDSNFCERVAEAIRTCGAEGVYDLLKESEEICFTSVSELGETEKAHLFGGTMPDSCNCPEDYGYGNGEGNLQQDPESPWRSCLRKLTKLWTSLGGRTICFADAPLYNSEDDATKLARNAVFDKNGCLRKGDSVFSCEESLDASESGADAISVCVNGEKRILVPTCNTMIIGCCDEEDENPKWVVRPRGYNLYLLDTPIEVHREALPGEGEDNVNSSTLPALVSVDKSFELNLIPDRCFDGKVYALVDFFWKTAQADGVTDFTIDISYNEEYYRKLITRRSEQDVSSWSFQDYVPLNPATPNTFKFRAVRTQGTGTYRSLVRILGFYA